MSASFLPGLMILWANLLTCLWISAAFLRYWMWSYIKAYFALSYSFLTLGTLYSCSSLAGYPLNSLFGNLNLTGCCQPFIILNLSLVWVGALSYSGVKSATTGMLALVYSVAAGFFFFLLFFFFFFFFFYSVGPVPSFSESLPSSYWF